jgi:hypothetical protein
MIHLFRVFRLSILTMLLLHGGALLAQTNPSKAAALAQQQLDAYNKRDINAFLEPYADTVAVYMFPNKLMYKGKETMRQEYSGMFAQTTDLHCTLVNRIVQGNTVIDQESVVFKKGVPPMAAIAIYTISGDKIVAVHFIPAN